MILRFPAAFFAGMCFSSRVAVGTFLTHRTHLGNIVSLLFHHKPLEASGSFPDSVVVLRASGM